MLILICIAFTSQIETRFVCSVWLQKGWGVEEQKCAGV